VFVCASCGWWRAEEYVLISHFAGTVDFAHRGLVSSLRHLDLSDISVPIGDVRAYLLARYQSRFQLHPTLMERTVASVFRDHGYEARVTGRSGDDGIDVILEKDGSQIGVQGKRYKNSIQVEQIRSLAGALVLNGLTKGIFVTTSSFQSGAEGTTQRLIKLGYAIELMDADRFYDALGIAQRTMYKSREEFNAIQTLPFMLPIVLSEGRRERPF
jgi:restriction system protein